ncbi:virB8 family protein [Variovorax ginsengisoli]|uniref:Type IV secretion system protein VirB8 n=1 Tax=Variovorax ginsengisoli TaxID=363844 RepID=A0ABT9SDG2_9BURK|nr:type IV secretion system protein [Variovorax ginsengisoli]MDP9902393.1 type IV secretion system protein VirB8 [Variovorax ginsengisoli]
MFRKSKASSPPDAPRSKDARRLSDLSWEASIVLNERKSRVVAWRVASGLGIVCLAQALALAMVVPLHSVVPYIVMVDKLTGEGQVVATAQEYVANSALTDKHWINNFLISRERYVYKFIQHDYDTVRRLAGNQPWASYSAQFEGADSTDKRFKDDVEILPTVLSITLDGNGTATVRYELRTRDYRSSTPPVVTRRVATLRYEYAVRNLTLEKEAIANPLGFTVTAYQTDAEMGGDAKAERR